MRRAESHRVRLEDQEQEVLAQVGLDVRSVLIIEVIPQQWGPLGGQLARFRQSRVLEISARCLNSPTYRPRARRRGCQPVVLATP
jgi:hypothetical protein